MKRDVEISAAIATAIEPFVAELAADLGKLLAGHVKSQLADAKRFAIEKLTAQFAGKDPSDDEVDPDLEPETEADPARHPRAPKDRAQQKRTAAAAAKPAPPPKSGKLTANGKRLPSCRKCGFYGGNTRGCGRSHPTQQKAQTSSSNDSEDESHVPRKRRSRAIEPEPERVIPHAALVAMLAADHAHAMADASGDAGGFVARTDREPSLVGHTEEKREVCPAHGWVGRMAFERDRHELCRPHEGPECWRCHGRRIVMGDFCSSCDGTGVEPPPVDSPEPEPRERPLSAAGFQIQKGDNPRQRVRVALGKRTIARGGIARDLAEGQRDVDAAGPPVDEPRPKTRGDCAGGPRPCAYVACSAHLYLDVNPRTGSITFNFPGVEPEEMLESCSLDLADRGGLILEDVGNLMNLTRERVRQIETKAKFNLIAALSARRREFGADR